LDSGIALAKQFADLVQTLANDVTIKLTPDAKGNCKVRTGRSQFTLPTIAPKDFPRFQPEEDENAVSFTIGAAALSKAINSAGLGLGKPDPVKAFTGGVLLKATPNGVFLVATNGFKFILVSVAGGTGEGGGTIQGIIPEMGVAQIERLAKAQASDGATLQFRMGPRQIVASAGDASVRSRLIGGGYPDYERVIRADAPVSLSVSQAALLAVLTRVGLFVTDKAPFVTLQLEDGRLACRTESTAGD
jgi:DNA polymerase-3 subunit beta